MPHLATTTDERPRERLARHGAFALAPRELIALVLGTGTRGASAPEVADRLLRRFGGSLAALSRAGASEFEQVDGLGPATACALAAAFELGRRAAGARLERGRRIAGPQDVFELMGPTLRDLGQEEFHVLLLDTRHRLMQRKMITRGTVDASLVHPREVFREAVASGAAALILVHNHPSGDPTPSAEDRAVTRQLVDVGRTVGIPVLDHVILGDGRYASVGAER